MRRLFLVALWLCSLSLLGWAERIDQQVAQRVARTVASGFKSATLRGSEQSLSLVYAAAAAHEGAALRSSGVPAVADYYVFNVGVNQGFVVVAGEDRVHPVLGYAEGLSFDPDRIPVGLRALLAQYQEEIDYAVMNDLERTDAIRSEWDRLGSGLTLRGGSEVVLLSTAKWSQERPYNNQTPRVGSRPTLTGCIATSLGILLQYARFPDQLVDGVSSYDGLPVPYGAYDWSLMPKSCPTSDAEIDQVSTLLWQIGANVKMEYGVVTSSTFDVNAAKFLREQARFNKGTRLIFKQDHYWPEWKAMIRETLRGSNGQGYPLLYRGDGDQGGHMFIIDGFGPEEYFHVNWGWGGYCDGNFLLTALEPEEFCFTHHAAMVYGAVPQTVVDTDVVELRNRQFQLKDAISVGEPFIIKHACINAGSVQHVYNIGIGVFDQEGQFKRVIN